MLRNNQTTRRRLQRRALVLSAAAVAVSTGYLIPTAASASPPPSDQSTAVVTPLLTLFEFGDSVGLPEGCQTALTAVSAVVAQADASKQFSPLAAEIGSQCQSVANEGSTYIEQQISASQSASALNALLNPGITDGSNLLTNLGNAPGIQDTPVGPTIAGLGQSVTFFSGSQG